MARKKLLPLKNSTKDTRNFVSDWKIYFHDLVL